MFLPVRGPCIAGATGAGATDDEREATLEQSVHAQAGNVGAEAPGSDPAEQVKRATERVAALGVALVVPVRVSTADPEGMSGGMSASARACSPAVESSAQAAEDPERAKGGREPREGNTVEQDARKHLRQDLQGLAMRTKGAEVCRQRRRQVVRRQLAEPAIFATHVGMSTLGTVEAVCLLRLLHLGDLGVNWDG
jgi:hypothetical protein